MSDVHTLIVTADADEPGDADLFSFEIRCPEVTDRCRMWAACTVTDCPGNTGGDDTLYDVSDVSHGVKHRYIDESWMVPTHVCYLTVADEVPDAAQHLASKLDLPAGEYTVEHDFDDGKLADFHLLKATS